MLNLVVASGTVKSLGLRYDSQARPELRFTLEQREESADGRTFTLFLPCCASSSAATRLAEEIEDGQHIVITSGKLCYRKRTTKAGEVSRLEILVWSIDRLSGVDAGHVSAEAEANGEAVEVACNLEAPEPVPGHKARKRAIPKHVQQAWQPEHAN